MTRRSGLGRGLGALIPQAPVQAGASALREVPLSHIRPNPYQPRKNFDEDALSSLVDSIKAVGILQPVLLRQMAEEEYELIAGERRFRAAHRAGLAVIPALVNTVDDATSLEQALVENVHREDLNPLDEAGAYQQLIEDFGMTHDEVGRRVGRSRVAITNALRLFQLPPTVQRLVRDGRLSSGAARALLATPDRVLQEKIANQAARGGLSVRAVESLIREQSSTEELEEVVDQDGSPTEVDESANDGDRPPALRPPGVLDLEELLGDHLSTRVRIDMGGKRGRVMIDFATLDDLERIYRVIIGEAT